MQDNPPVGDRFIDFSLVHHVGRNNQKIAGRESVLLSVQGEAGISLQKQQKLIVTHMQMRAVPCEPPSDHVTDRIESVRRLDIDDGNRQILSAHFLMCILRRRDALDQQHILTVRIGQFSRFFHLRAPRES